jgi:hypothetical protein
MTQKHYGKASCLIVDQKIIITKIMEYLESNRSTDMNIKMVAQ